MAMTKPTSDQINFQNSVALPGSLHVAGNAIISGTISGGTLASSMLPSASLLQIIVGKSETPYGPHTSGTGADTGLSATITPQRATSAILVFVYHNIRLYRTTSNTSNMQCQIRLHRNASGSPIANWTPLAINGAPTAALDHYTTLNSVYLDLAGGTAPLTYNTKVANTGGANTAVDLNASATNPMILVLAEIAA